MVFFSQFSKVLNTNLNTFPSSTHTHTGSVKKIQVRGKILKVSW